MESDDSIVCLCALDVTCDSRVEMCSKSLQERESFVPFAIKSNLISSDRSKV